MRYIGHCTTLLMTSMRSTFPSRYIFYPVHIMKLLIVHFPPISCHFLPPYVPIPPLQSLFWYSPNLILVSANEIRILISKPKARQKYNSAYCTFYVSVNTSDCEPWRCKHAPCLTVWRKEVIIHTAWFAMQQTGSLSTTRIAAICQDRPATVTQQLLISQLL
jgi:hypothetical protein